MTNVVEDIVVADFLIVVAGLVEEVLKSFAVARDAITGWMDARTVVAVLGDVVLGGGGNGT